MHSSHTKNFLVGVFEDEDIILDAVHHVREAGMRIHEVYSPYPIHNMDIYLGYKRSNLPKAAFMFGFTGAVCALTMIYYMLAYDWPMNIGGKHNFALPDFVPITFECTVLFAAFGMTGTFLVASNLLPWAKPVIFDKRASDDKFLMAIDLGKNKKSKEEIVEFLKSQGAVEVNEKEI